MKKLNIVGFSLTFIWCLFFVLLLYFYYKNGQLKNIKINEWGDFFSGAVAPLALFWLVIGYLQQGEELRLNNDALRSQQEELRRQAQETAILAKNTERQAVATEQLALASKSEAQRNALKEEASLLPLFRYGGGMGNAEKTEINITNIGETIKNVSIHSSLNISLEISPTTLFQKNQKGKIIVGPAPSYPFIFEIKFHNLKGLEQTQKYEMLSQFSFTEIFD